MLLRSVSPVLVGLAFDLHLNGLGLRSEVKLLQFQRRQQCGGAALPLRTADALGRADHFDVARSKHLDPALIEPEVTHRILNLAVGYEPYTVAGEPCCQRRAWVNRTDVPEAADQQSAFGGLYHLFDTRWTRRTFQDAVHWTRCRLLSLLLRPKTGVYEVFQNAAAHESAGKELFRAAVMPQIWDTSFCHLPQFARP